MGFVKCEERLGAKLWVYIFFKSEWQVQSGTSLTQTAAVIVSRRRCDRQQTSSLLKIVKHKLSDIQSDPELQSLSFRINYVLIWNRHVNKGNISNMFLCIVYRPLFSFIPPFHFPFFLLLVWHW